MTKEQWPPINKFACKLHGYIVYLSFRDSSIWTSTLLQEDWSVDRSAIEPSGYISSRYNCGFSHIKLANTFSLTKNVLVKQTSEDFAGSYLIQTSLHIIIHHWHTAWKSYKFYVGKAWDCIKDWVLYQLPKTIEKVYTYFCSGFHPSDRQTIYRGSPEFCKFVHASLL